MIRVKEEVKKLCVEFANAPKGSKRFLELEEILKRKYRFTAWNLLALFGANPTIEYNTGNFGLVTEECGAEARR